MRRCSKFAEFRWGYSAELARKREGTRIGTVHGKRQTLDAIKNVCASCSTGSVKAKRAAEHQRRANANKMTLGV
jgi:hypothetical protein